MALLGVGERLRDARVARGLSFDEIEATTRIRRRFLEALEAERFEELPGPAYVRAFLGAYAAHLGLPADDLLALYPGVHGALASRRSPLDVRITPATPRSRLRRLVSAIAVVFLVGAAFVAYTLYDQLRQFAVSRPPASGGPSAAPSGPAPAGRSVPGAAPSGGPAPSAAGAAQPGTAGSAGGTLQGGSARPAPQPGPAPAPPGTSPPAQTSPGSPPGALQALPPATPSPAPTPQKPAAAPAQAIPPGTAAPAPQGGGPPPSSATSVRVTVVANDRSWVRAVADGTTVFEGFLSAGDHQVWEANHQLSLRIGNASALDVSVNGQPLGRLGNPGDVWERTFAAGAVSTP